MIMLIEYVILLVHRCDRNDIVSLTTFYIIVENSSLTFLAVCSKFLQNVTEMIFVKYFDCI